MTSGGRSMCSSAMRPRCGTGHSTSPATSSSRPGSSTTVRCFSAASPAMRSAMIRLRSAASTSTRCAVSFSRQSAAEDTAKAPGTWKRWPSVRLALARPWPSSAPSRRSNGTTAPSSRQMMRRSGRTQTKLLVPPQRMDFGHGNRRSRPGIALAIRVAADTSAALFLQHPVVAFLPHTARGSRCACAGIRSAPAPAR